MCTRFCVESGAYDLAEIIAKAGESKLNERFRAVGKILITSGEVRPTDVAAVIAPNRQGEPAAYPMRWGFTLPGRQPLVNARLETAAVKPTFRESWERRRCIIPASWYYEWDHVVNASGRRVTGDKYKIWQEDAPMILLGGLYRIEEGLPVFTVLTTTPGESVSRIHDRMPFILPKEAAYEWIRPGSDPSVFTVMAKKDLMMEVER